MLGMTRTNLATVFARLSLAIILIAFAALATARDPAQVRAFRKTHPYPSTHKTTGACPGHVVDHKWPLCLGGLDHPDNMQWQTTAESYVKDRLEREACRLRKVCPLR